MSFMLLGILNSQAAGGGVPSSYDHITTTTLTSSTSQISVSLGANPYADYKHLRILFMSRSTRNDIIDTVRIRFNNQTASGYSFHGGRVENTDWSTGDSKGTFFPYITLNKTWASQVNSNAWTQMTLEFPNFRSTDMKPQVLFSGGGMAAPNNSSATQVKFGSGLNSNISASSVLSSVQFLMASDSFAAGTEVRIYGLKDA